MLHVRYVHFTEAKRIHETTPSSRLRGCYIRTRTIRVQLQKKNGRGPQAASPQDELIGGKPPVVNEL
jgi:hypothetical protein